MDHIKGGDPGFRFIRMPRTVADVSSSRSLLTLLVGSVLAAVLTAVGLAPVAGVVGYTAARTNEAMESHLADLTDGTAPGVTTITDGEGTPIAWLYKQRRYPVPSEQISQPMKAAMVSIEDRRFYEHDGVDLQGTARALVANLLSGGVSQGASTINQQYVKNYLLLVTAQTDEERIAATETSIPRKLREMRMASDLDKMLDKDEILTRYLNLVSFGNGAYGVEAAAQTYFNQRAVELNVAQAAMLAGIVQSSSYLDPYTNADAVLERRNTVIDSMVSTGALDQGSAAAAKAEPLGITDAPEQLPNGCISAGDRGFMCDYALQYLASKGVPPETLTQGSYTVRTTLDPQIQDAAHAAVTEHVDPKQPGVAEVLNVVEPGRENREIRAMTSSRDYGLAPERGETVLPQPSSMVGNGAGSVFKIFTAAVALDQGVTLNSVLPVPTRYEATGMGAGGAAGCPPDAYCVENAGTYPPSMTLQEALAQSPNTTFVQLIERVGVAPVVDMAVKLGLRSYAEPESWDEETSIADFFKASNLGSFTLGPTAVNALELSNVGASVAAGGRWCEPNPIESLTDHEGNEVFIDRPECEDVLSTSTAHALMAGMSRDAERGTAARAAKDADWSGTLASKTGTTESHHSAAFIGFNSNLAAAPYIYNDGTETTPLCSHPVSQCGDGSLYGGDEPAETWFSMANAIPSARSGTLGGAKTNQELRRNEGAESAPSSRDEGSSDSPQTSQPRQPTNRPAPLDLLPDLREEVDSLTNRLRERLGI